MKKYLKFLFITLYMFLNLSNSVTSDEFIFEGEEIEILNEGKKLVSRKGVKVTTDDNIKITADEFEYDKEKKEIF